MKLPKVGKPKKANSVLQQKTTGRKMQFAEINTAVVFTLSNTIHKYYIPN